MGRAPLSLADDLNSRWVSYSYRLLDCWTTVPQALDLAFADAVPYAAVVVELDEGPHLTTWVTDVSLDELHLGMPVEVWFDNVTDEVTLPKFKPHEG